MRGKGLHSVVCSYCPHGSGSGGESGYGRACVCVFMYFTSHLSSSSPGPQVTVRISGLMNEARDITKGFMASWLKKHCWL